MSDPLQKYICSKGTMQFAEPNYQNCWYKQEDVEVELDKLREFVKAYDELELGGDSAAEHRLLIDKLAEKREALPEGDV